MTHLSSLLHLIDLHWLWLAVAAFLAGVLNAVAGGGSFLLFPAMLGMKMLPVQANATNTVALWPGQVTSIAAYWQDIRKNRRLAWPMGIAGFLGGTAGAIVLLNTPQTTFLHLVPWLLLVAASIFAATSPVSRWLARRKAAASSSGRPPRLLLVFLCTIFVCFYIGYFGAGAGFLIMSALALFGVEEMHELNSLKVLAACLSNFCAVVTFVLSGAVIWHYCLISMIFAGVGGYVGAQYARRMNANVLRTIVVVTGVAMAAYFFWRQS